MTASGYPFPYGVPDLGIPIEDRCWSCDKRRIHHQGDGKGGDRECVAGLCAECCARLRKPEVA